jgi:hypothetical protein
MLDHQHKQAQFAAHLRDPENTPAPDNIEDRRLKIYRELFYNNIENFLSSGFPVFKSLFAQNEWHALVRDFYATHKAHSPYFLEISEEFLQYLSNDELPIHQQYPFAQALTHYEWVELALDVSDETPQEDVNVNGDLMHELPVLSGLAWPLVYEWPVHMIGKTFQPQQPSEQPVCLVVYRNADEKVAFLEANPLTLRLLEIIGSEEPLSGKDALIQLAQEMQQSDVESIIQFGKTILEQLHSLGIILGTLKH